MRHSLPARRVALFLCGFLALANQAMAIDVPPKAISGATLFNVNDTSNATFAALAAGGSGVYNRVLRLGVSLSSADNITVKCGTTTKIGPLYLGANSGLIYLLDMASLKCGNNEAVNITKGTAATPVTVFGESRAE